MVLGPRYFRVLASYVVAAVAAVLCAWLGHVRVSVRDPHTWHHVVEHRCGMLMLVCVAWAVVEMLLALVMPREEDSFLMPQPAR